MRSFALPRHIDNHYSYGIQILSGNLSIWGGASPVLSQAPLDDGSRIHTNKEAVIASQPKLTYNLRLRGTYCSLIIHELLLLFISPTTRVEL